MKKESAFEKWFKKQFGKRPLKTTLQHLLAKRDSLKSQLYTIDLEISAIERYISRKDAAYKAWVAAEYIDTQEGINKIIGG